ncbi:hypothetical protein D1007_05565 [Hordeum vulgare]|nr:hypothetical protein D1007_05565 [Hordeum vulgare]
MPLPRISRESCFLRPSHAVESFGRLTHIFFTKTRARGPPFLAASGLQPSLPWIWIGALRADLVAPSNIEQLSSMRAVGRQAEVVEATVVVEKERASATTISNNIAQEGGLGGCAFDRAKHGSCGYVKWHDDELPKKFSDLIGDLRDEVWRLKGKWVVPQVEEQTAMVAPNEDETTMMLVSVKDELRKKNVELAVVKAKYENVVSVRDEVRKKTPELATVKANNENVVFIFVVFVDDIVAGNIKMQ